MSTLFIGKHENDIHGKVELLCLTSFAIYIGICHFGIPKRILSDNGAPFVDFCVRQLCEEYGVHIKSAILSSKKWPSETTNKTLLQMHDGLRGAYMMGMFPVPCAMGLSYLEMQFDSSHTFFPIYEVKTMVLIKVMAPSARLELAIKLSNSNDRICDIEDLK